MKIDESTVMRFVDGSLSEEEAAVVEQTLEVDKVLQQKVLQMQLSDLPFAEAFSDKSMPPMPDTLIKAIEQADRAPVVDQPVKSRLFSLKVASLCGLFFLAGFFIQGGAEQWSPFKAPQSAISSPLADAMIQYQALYTRDTVAPVNQTPADAQALIDAFNQSYGREVVIPNLESQGYRFRRVQQLAYEDQPILQMVYMGETGEPIALCLTLSEQVRAAQPYEYAGMNSYLWQANGLGFMLMAKLPFTALEQLLDSIKTA